MKKLISVCFMGIFMLMNAQSIRPGTYTLKLASENKNISNHPVENADLKVPCAETCLEQVWILKIVRGKPGYFMIQAAKSKNILTFIQIGPEKSLNQYIFLERLLNPDLQHLQSFKVVPAGDGTYYIKPGDYDSYLVKSPNDRIYFKADTQNIESKRWVITPVSYTIVPQTVIVTPNSPIHTTNSVIVTPPGIKSPNK